MNEAVFISDLHLSPFEPEITKRFEAWIDWALLNAQSVYILGDFFHAWAGDDTLDEWGHHIATQLARFAKHQIPVFFMHGNRDFLLGKTFANIAKIQYIKEPYRIEINQISLLLVHGDRYCSLDKKHQWFRRLTRNPFFIRLFSSLPKKWRVALVRQTRKQSQQHQSRMQTQMMDVVISALEKHVIDYQVDVIIHGHTHQPKMINHMSTKYLFKQIILSDWEETPSILCYDHSKGFYFYLHV